MGGVVSGLFGGSKQKSSSGNQAFGQLQGLLSGNIGQGNSAMSAIANLLGVGGGDSSGAYKNYLDSTGYQAMMDSGTKAITGSNAARGLFQSGATGKALTTFGQNLGKQSFNDYLGQLSGLGQYGLNSANTLANAGQTSSSSGKSSTGIVNSLFSDRRLKQNITLLRRAADGLGIYSYEYIFAAGKRVIGVMADEVAKLRPQALGPVVGGFATVQYDKLTEA